MADLPDRLRRALAPQYEVEHELGAGGMATVYLARDVRHERQVAIKVLKPELAAVLGAERFLQEIKTTARAQAYVAWSAVHGLASLVIEGQILATVDVDGLIRQTMRTLLDGMRVVRRRRGA